jgi:hypothetical protein
MCFHSHMECFCCSSFDKHNTKKSTVNELSMGTKQINFKIKAKFK